MTVSAYVAKLVREDVGEVELTDAERKWVEEHRAAPRHAAEVCSLGGLTKRMQFSAESFLCKAQPEKLASASAAQWSGLPPFG